MEQNWSCWSETDLLFEEEKRRMKVGDLVRVAPGQREPWSGQLGIIVEIDDDIRGHPVDMCTMLISGAKKWFDLDELELVE